MISGVSKVVVAVDDQERAKQFWMTRIGFELHRDESYGQEGWIEVFPAPPRREHFGWWSLVEDPDGTRYALGRWDR
jgi:catechol 2,3-dioxygenase-like lactoylglutathione lyase family enzyme